MVSKKIAKIVLAIVILNKSASLQAEKHNNDLKKAFYECLTYFTSLTTKAKEKPQFKAFGANWSISVELFNYVRDVLPRGKTMIELGSGWASGQFSKFYTVYSVEHDKKWVGKYNTNYIHAPIKNKWYDTNVLKKKLPKTYDLILVDGPPGFIGRGGFYKNLHLFNTDVTIIFDDVNRKAEHKLMENVSKKLNRPYKIFTDSSRKKFGVIAAKK